MTIMEERRGAAGSALMLSGFSRLPIRDIL
jgi:hypothetical protein